MVSKAIPKVNSKTTSMKRKQSDLVAVKEQIETANESLSVSKGPLNGMSVTDAVPNASMKTGADMGTLDEEQVRKAMKALFAFKNKSRKVEEPSNKSQLLDGDHVNAASDQTLFLVIGTKTMPEKLKSKPQRILLKHAIMDRDSTDVCVFTKDPQREYKDLFIEKDIKVAKVIGISKLRSKYMPYEAKRQLAASFDLFLADDRIVPLLPKLLGKSFYEKKKMPIPVKLSSTEGVKKEMENVMHSTFIRFSKGSCVTIKMGHLGQDLDEVVENIMGSIEAIIEKMPSGWKNIQSIHVKSKESMALPVYNCIPGSHVIETSKKAKVAEKELEKEKIVNQKMAKLEEVVAQKSSAEKKDKSTREKVAETAKDEDLVSKKAKGETTVSKKVKAQKKAHNKSI